MTVHTTLAELRSRMLYIVNEPEVVADPDGTVAAIDRLMAHEQTHGCGHPLALRQARIDRECVLILGRLIRAVDDCEVL